MLERGGGGHHAVVSVADAHVRHACVLQGEGEDEAKEVKLANRADVVDVWPKLPDERPIYLSALARTPNPNPLPPLSGKPADETFLSVTKGRIGSDEYVACTLGSC